MKSVKVLFDEHLLAELDVDDRVEALGRSRVLRELAASYLRRRREAALDVRYVIGYRGRATHAPELQDWVEGGVWPES
jgi:hypothetical protein